MLDMTNTGIYNEEVIRSYLVGLGDTADEVEATLRKLGISMSQPTVNRARNCPIGQYARRMGFGNEETVASIRYLMVGNTDFFLYPKPVQDFVARFDQGDIAP